MEFLNLIIRVFVMLFKLSLCPVLRGAVPSLGPAAGPTIPQGSTSTFMLSMALAQGRPGDCGGPARAAPSFLIAFSNPVNIPMLIWLGECACEVSPAKAWLAIRWLLLCAVSNATCCAVPPGI